MQGKRVKHVTKSFFLQGFAVLGLPQEVKTKPLRNFFTRWSIALSMGIGYNPQSQVIVERYNQTLKQQLEKLKGESLTPLLHLNQVLLTHNSLNISKEDGLLAFAQCWKKEISQVPSEGLLEEPRIRKMKGSESAIVSRHGFGSVFPQEESRFMWVLARNIKYVPRKNTDNEDSTQAYPT